MPGAILGEWSDAIGSGETPGTPAAPQLALSGVGVGVFSSLNLVLDEVKAGS